jgi:hypothetical protein
MNRTVIVRCPHCKQKNNVAFRRGPVCGLCKADLTTTLIETIGVVLNNNCCQAHADVYENMIFMISLASSRESEKPSTCN